MKQYDVVIAGGAMAGMTLALALDRLSCGSFRIAVVEPYQADQQQHPGFDSRAIALSQGTVAILRQFDLWRHILDVATPIQHIHVSDRGHAGMTEISREQSGGEPLGFVVELADVGRAFAQLAEQSSAITMLCPDSVASIERQLERTQVRLQSGSELSAKLLVAADGALSTCCQQLGLSLQEHDFNQVAVIANVVCSQPHHFRAFERFTDSGPVALLPMSEGRMSLVWCLRPDEAGQVMALNDQQFLARLQRAFGWRLGEMKATGARACYPLLLRYRPENISHRFAIVGNAAQTLHPIAGQGFNLGIRDVASLAEEIMRSPEDPGQYQVLSAFRNRRQQDRQATIALTSGLVEIFSNNWLPMRIGRNLGLAAVDHCTPLKAPLLKRTLGLVKR
ncbi:2-octaprenyl-6-methoxyphenyl hydroxylase [Vibrio sp.]|uniref:2-octaprenyl-6-methoxyphenyl hydroxylase n=1 Tax=Vibrio sp. TaxID=678 RepID=UPI003D135A6C